MSNAALHRFQQTSSLARCTLLLLILTSVLAGGLLVVPAADAAVTGSHGPLVWTAPAAVSSQPIDGLSCPSVSLCVAVDRGGQVVWSSDPAGGSGQWTAVDVDASDEITGISCPSTALCVAVDAAGDVITSQNPTGGQLAWTVTRVDTSKTQNNTDNAGSVLVRGVSCPSTALCVAVDAAGNALVSTDPAGGATAWTVTHIDTNTSYDCTGSGLTCQPPVVGISCPSTTLCAAVDFSGNVLTTSDPDGMAPWTSTPAGGGGLISLYGISCPAIGFCETVDGDAGRAISLNPADPSMQTTRSLSDSLDGIWCQSPSLCLASVQTQNGISGLIGSFDPAAVTSTWPLSSLGGVTAAACPSASLCIAADDEGEIAAGATITSISAGLTENLVKMRHLPTIASLDRTQSDTVVFASPIAAQVTLDWTVAGTDGARVTVASVSQPIAAPGRTKLTVRLSTAGRYLFSHATRAVTLTATAAFATSTGSVSAAGKLTFRHPPRKPHTR